MKNPSPVARDGRSTPAVPPRLPGIPGRSSAVAARCTGRTRRALFGPDTPGRLAPPAVTAPSHLFPGASLRGPRRFFPIIANMLFLPKIIPGSGLCVKSQLAQVNRQPHLPLRLPRHQNPIPGSTLFRAGISSQCGPPWDGDPPRSGTSRTQLRTHCRPIFCQTPHFLTGISALT